MKSPSPSPFTSPARASTAPVWSDDAAPSATLLGRQLPRSTAPPSCGRAADAGTGEAPRAATASRPASTGLMRRVVFILGRGGPRDEGLHLFDRRPERVTEALHRQLT